MFHSLNLIWHDISNLLLMIVTVDKLLFIWCPHEKPMILHNETIVILKDYYLITT